MVYQFKDLWMLRPIWCISRSYSCSQRVWRAKSITTESEREQHHPHINLQKIGKKLKCTTWTTVLTINRKGSKQLTLVNFPTWKSSSALIRSHCIKKDICCCNKTFHQVNLCLSIAEAKHTYKNKGEKRNNWFAVRQKKRINSKIYLPAKLYAY